MKILFVLLSAMILIVATGCNGSSGSKKSGASSASVPTISVKVKASKF